MPEHRVVVDTNIWVSYLIFRRGLIAKAGQFFAQEKARLIASEQCLDELREVLSREKWDEYTPRDARLLFFEGVYQRCTIIKPTTTFTLCRDAKDNKFLELAHDGGADFLVTGDKDLLELASKPDPTWKFRIVSPGEYMRVVKGV